MTISVRGSAQTTIAPDLATVFVTVDTASPTKAESLRKASRAVDAAVSAVVGLGGAVKPSDDSRLPLAYLVGVTSTRVETRWDDKNQKEIETGRVLASGYLTVEVRDFALLDGLAEQLGAVEDLSTRSVGWSVDHDNPVRARMRSDAVAEAISRARDYAAALGGSLVRIDQLGDSGLLGDTVDWKEQSHASPGSPFGAARTTGGGVPHLDPAPQTVSAVVDARFIASVAPL